MKQWRLPKAVHLPGFVIKVETVSMTDLESAEYVYGEDGGVIRIGKGMTTSQQKYYFSQELIHAIVDYHHRMVTHGSSW